MPADAVTLFELRSLPEGRAKQRVFLLQLPHRAEFAKVVEVPTTVGRLDGTSLAATRPSIAAILQNNNGHGVNVADDAFTEDRVYPVGEDAGMRLHLLFEAAQIMRSPEKMQQVGAAIAAMEPYDVTYWHKKITQDKQGPKRFVTFLSEG